MDLWILKPHREPINIRAVNNDLLLYIDSTFPAEKRSVLLHRVRAFMEAREKLSETDTAALGDVFSFLAILFDIYNRCGEHGTSAPENVHPYYMQKCDGARFNYQQIKPYPSKDLQELESLYQDIVESLGDVISHIQASVSLPCHTSLIAASPPAKVEHNLKEECQILQASLECLPTSTSHDFNPWSSIVVNFNCTTIAHKDLKDQLLCGVLVIGDCEGGDLCFYEPGLVLPLRSGDFVAFHSSRITHFNLDFKETCVSVVFHSDSNIQSWVHNRNGWIKNIFYK